LEDLVTSWFKFRAVVTAAVVAPALSGCGGRDASDPLPLEPSRRDTSASAPPMRAASLCNSLQSRVIGRVEIDDADELSGLVLSRSQARVLWTHNDSGDDARLFAVAPDGSQLAEVAVTGAQNDDWEDIAVGPGGALHIGDIGDNDAEREEIVVYRVSEPRLDSGAPSETAPAQRLALRYPDGPHNAEALLLDPRNGAIVIVTKSRSGDADIYVAERPSASATTTMRHAGSVSLGRGSKVTAGDVSADGSTIALRTYDRAFVWSRRRGESLVSALRRAPCTAGAQLRGEGQGETIALTADGRAFYTIPEGGQPAVRRYAPDG
jgi:hypothetical protein